jgi:putative polyhydroxyalkanoate system protein
MSDIKMTKAHAHGKDEAKKRIDRLLGKMADGMGLKTEWDGDTCKFTGPAKGEIKVGEQNVDVEVKLGLAAKMMKGTIEKKLAEGLDRALS